MGLGFEVVGLGFVVLGLGFVVLALRFDVSGLGYVVLGLLGLAALLEPQNLVILFVCVHAVIVIDIGILETIRPNAAEGGAKRRPADRPPPVRRCAPAYCKANVNRNTKSHSTEPDISIVVKSLPLCTLSFLGSGLVKCDLISSVRFSLV